MSSASHRDHRRKSLLISSIIILFAFGLSAGVVFGGDGSSDGTGEVDTVFADDVGTVCSNEATGNVSVTVNVNDPSADSGGLGSGTTASAIVTMECMGDGTVTATLTLTSPPWPSCVQTDGLFAGQFFLGGCTDSFVFPGLSSNTAYNYSVTWYDSYGPEAATLTTGGTFTSTNCASVSVGGSGEPDLRVPVPVVNGVLEVGQELTISGMVENNGTAEAVNSTARFCWASQAQIDAGTVDGSNCSGATTIGDRSTGVLGPGASTPLTSLPWTPPGEGKYYVYLVADINNVVGESNEGNNYNGMNFTVAPAIGNVGAGTDPDLVVAPIDPTSWYGYFTDSTPITVTSVSGDPVLYVGQPLKISGRIVNVGGGGAGNSTARFCVGKVGAAISSECKTVGFPDTIVVDDQGTGPISGSGHWDGISAQWTPTETGSYYAYIAADFGNVVGEDNPNEPSAGQAETNNTNGAPFTVVVVAKQCSDGNVDNDTPPDGVADMSDPGCYDTGGYDPNDDSEVDTRPVCSNYFDDDGDGKVDHSSFNPSNPDDGCSSASDTSETGIAAGPISLDISASPGTVAEGGGSILTWSATGVESCEVKDQNNTVLDSFVETYTDGNPDNGNAWNGTPYPVNNVTSEQVYTLSCVPASGGSEQVKFATVHVVPSFEPF